MIRRYSPTDKSRLAARLWRRVAFHPGDGCWEWTGAVTSAGYGQLRIGRGPAIGTHRLSYLLGVGEIPEGLYVCHRCDNPRCIRPSHLFLGTNRDNQLDAQAKGRGRSGTTRLTPAEIIEIRARLELGETHDVIARDFGVSRPAITAINTRRNWREVA